MRPEALNIRNGKQMTSLAQIDTKSEFYSIAAKELAKRYTHWRMVKADGNCYYRAVYVGYLEYLILKKDPNQLLEFIYTIDKEVGYYSLSEEQMSQHAEQYIPGMYKNTVLGFLTNLY